MNEYLAGFQRILAEDLGAVVLTGLLVMIQIGILLWMIAAVYNPLSRAAKRVQSFARALGETRVPAKGELEVSGPQVVRAWRLVFEEAETATMYSAAEAFDSTRLLPPDYNPRLDAAAPGLFTALGILGTFIGLILGFLRVDPGNATVSVGPLIGGMVVAFFNSLIGVLFSILWSVASRRNRHVFDCATGELLDKVERRIPMGDPAGRLTARMETLIQTTAKLRHQLDSGFGSIRNGLGELGNRTSESSRELLENLAPRIEEAVRPLVNTPFDRLDASVTRFDQIVRDAAASQEQIARQNAASAETLSRAESEFAAAMDAGREWLDRFMDAANALTDHATVMEELLEHTRAATDGLGSVTADVRSVADRYDEAAGALTAVSAGLLETARTVGAQSTEFRGATANLQATVSAIGELARAGAQEGAAAVRGELKQAVDAMAAGLREVGETTVTAYEQSSIRIMNTVNARVTDLTDRLSAELSTLSARLPAEVEALNGAMAQIRASIHRATRSMDEAANDLAKQTPERLRAYLGELDEAMAKAVSHFSGTLARWDEHMSDVGELTAELRRLSSALENRRRIRLPHTEVAGA